jgi:hypothetical protein
MLAVTAAMLVAATPPPPPPTEYVILAPALQIAMPNRIAPDERSYRKGEAVVDVPLLWRAAIRLDNDLNLTIDGGAEQVKAGTVLPLHLVGAGIYGKPKPAYCTPRRAAEDKSEKGALGILLGGGSLWRGLIRGATDRQLCLIDSDGDDHLDQWLLIGDGSAAARAPNPMPGVAFTRQDNVPISDKDRYTIFFNGASGSGKWAEFRLELMQQGNTRRFDTMSGPFGTFNRLERRARLLAQWPLLTTVHGADLTIMSTEDGGKTARLIGRGSADPDRQIEIPDAYRVSFRYY